jgi:hypothetical protein
MRLFSQDPRSLKFMSALTQNRRIQRDRSEAKICRDLLSARHGEAGDELRQLPARLRRAVRPLLQSHVHRRSMRFIEGIKASRSSVSKRLVVRESSAGCSGLRHFRIKLWQQIPAMAARRRNGLDGRRPSSCCPLALSNRAPGATDQKGFEVRESALLSTYDGH